MTNSKKQITESLDVIYAYALKKCRDRHEAEDLSQEIILTLYQSLPKLKDPDKFYGWMWGVASNVYKSHVRKNLKHQTIRSDDYELISKTLLESDYIELETSRRLFKEISRLSGVYREAIRLYYMDGKSCDEIAKRLTISSGMVKQYLFQSRKKLKEGMSMFKESGELSFNPRAFKLNFWGTKMNYRSEIFKRKLPGNILLESCYEPKTIEELSVEMGVSAVYLEDEINILLENQLMVSPVRNKYLSNIVILTKVFLDELALQSTLIYQKLVGELEQCITANEDLRNLLSFDYKNQNEFKWQMISFILLRAMRSSKLHQKLDAYPHIQGEEYGFMWGLEQQHNDVNKGFGVYTYDLEGGYEIQGLDYSRYSHKNYLIFKEDELSAITKLLNGVKPEESKGFQNLLNLKLITENELNLPVYSKDETLLLDGQFKEVIDLVNEESVKLYEVVKKIMKNHVPKSVRHHIDDVAALTVANDTFFMILEESMSKQLIQEEENTLCCLSTYIVKN